jgi:hypothetical protein
VITTCPKCHQLFEALEADAAKADRRCPRCSVFLDAIALLDEIANRGKGGRTTMALISRTLIANARAVVERAKSL